MSVCNSIRHCSRLQLGTFRQPVLAVRARQTRGLATSSFPLSSRIPTRSTLLHVSGCSTRSYWWSSRTKTPESSPPSGTEVPRSDHIGALESKSSSEVALTDTTTNLATSEQAAANHDSVIASVPDLPSDVIIPPPALQLGDLKELGFSNFTPVGAVQSGLEFVQVTTGLPWWATIILSTLLARFAILHFTIQSTRAGAKMAPFRPQMEVLMKEANEAKAVGDQLRLQVAALKLAKLRKDNGVSFLASLAGPLSQAVVSISMFIGIKRLCDFPLAQIKFESIGWLTSLAAPDPFYILPALSLALMNLQIHLTRAEMAAGGQHMLHFANAFRLLGVLFLPFVANLPSGLLLYLVSNIGFVALQNRVLRAPAVRRALDIPPLPAFSPAQAPSFRDTWHAFREWLRNKSLEANHKARERAKVPTFPVNSTTSTRKNLRQASGGRKV